MIAKRQKAAIYCKYRSKLNVFGVPDIDVLQFVVKQHSKINQQIRIHTWKRSTQNYSPTTLPTYSMSPPRIPACREGCYPPVQYVFVCVAHSELFILSAIIFSLSMVTSTIRATARHGCMACSIVVCMVTAPWLL